MKNLNTSLDQDTTGKIEAEVTFENLDNGLTETLEDTIVEFEGIKTHNFKTTLEINPETILKDRNESKNEFTLQLFQAAYL